MIRRIVFILFFIFLLSTAAGGAFLVWGYHYITRDLPQLSRIEDYRPAAVSEVYSANGVLIAEFFKDERRYPVALGEVPLFVRNAFLAAEDASFYQHPGIDLISIARAFFKNVQTGSATQGGSTITQQVVKNLLLSTKKKLTRKIKEAILAYRIEQRLSKDDILQIYLNEIYFGNGAYGIKAAAKAYFRKELDELTLGDAALLAGLPKAPNNYSPLRNKQRALRRQRYVLNQMVREGFITAGEAANAKKEFSEVYRFEPRTLLAAPYYGREVRRIFEEKFPALDLDRDGLRVVTAVDLKAQELATEALREGLRAVDKRRGWRGPIGFIQNPSETDLQERLEELETGVPSIQPAVVTAISGNEAEVTLLSGESGSLSFQASSWAKRRRSEEDRVYSEELHRSLRRGDVVEVRRGEGETLLLEQTPEVEGAVVLIDPTSGKVVSLVGGYDYQRSQFNRVTQSLRQPGSAFKPIVYLAAVDGFRHTAATLVHDVPRTFKVGDQYWTPGNYDESFLGAIPLRMALEKSRNLVSADIISRIGVEAVIRYARALGIESRLGRNLSLSLGSSEVTLLEMTRAYGVLANRGVLFPSLFVTRIQDRDGRLLYEGEDEQIEKAKQVVSPESAFVMAHMMKGVVERGTGWRVREIKRPVAGKTGTSNDLMDTWFIGYTPEWVCGVWVGFDVKKTIGKGETGGKVASPIWLDFMRPWLDHVDERRYEELASEVRAEAEALGIEYEAPEPIPPSDFLPPDRVEPYWVDRYTGNLSDPSNPNAVFEYFVEGTEPSTAQLTEEAVDYLGASEL